jgi:hypothetical protein
LAAGETRDFARKLRQVSTSFVIAPDLVGEVDEDLGLGGGGINREREESGKDEGKVLELMNPSPALSLFQREKERSRCGANRIHEAKAVSALGLATAVQVMSLVHGRTV